MSRGEAIGIGVLVALGAAVFGGGAAIVITAARGRREVFAQVRDAAAAFLAAARPDLTDAARLRAGEILGAQAVLETGGGQTRAWREGWNFGNVSRGSWAGPVIPGGDLEYDAAGNVTRIGQEWRKYASLAAAVEDLFELLGWARYRPARTALLAGDAAGYVRELRAGGYFTAPLGDYLAGVESALRSYA